MERILTSPHMIIGKKTWWEYTGIKSINKPNVIAKFIISLLFAFAWFLFSFWLGLKWINELREYLSFPVAFICILGVAVIPGFMNIFLLFSLWLDRPPKEIANPCSYPPLTIIIACYNESRTITQTVEHLMKNNYSSLMEIILVDDGSQDETYQKCIELKRRYNNNQYRFKIIHHYDNQGKSAALNNGLKMSSFDFIVTIDADTFLHPQALERIVKRLLNSTSEHKTGAVAGSILLQNRKESWITRLQNYDYLLNITAVKRQQSMYEGTLVGQGAFSIDTKEAIE